jgi:hypothetical protein
VHISSLRAVLVATLTALCCLVAATSSALAAGAAPSALPVRACNFEVCETLLVLPPPRLEVNATAMPTAVRCGAFVMTITSRGVTRTVRSPLICSIRPAYTFVVEPIGLLPPLSTIAMQFQSTPPTPGKPIIRV